MTRNILTIDSRPFGFFSIFLHTIDCLRWAEINRYEPFVRWGSGRYNTNLYREGAKEAIYYDNPKMVIDKNNFVTSQNKKNNSDPCLYAGKDDDNPWEYYFHPIVPIDFKDGDMKNSEYNIKVADIFMCGEFDSNLDNKFLIKNLHSYDGLKLWNLTDNEQIYKHRKEIEIFIKKNVIIKKEIIDKVKFFKQKTMCNSEILIGVHIRGTDKKTEFPFRQLKIEDYIATIKSTINQQHDKKYKIYVASDTNEAIIKLINEFGKNNVVSYPCIRMPNYNGNIPIHLSKNIDNKLHGEETLIEMLLLSECNVIIGTDSNLTATASFFNPEAELKYLDRRMGV